jgi:LacI family transcriptional regulator
MNDMRETRRPTLKDVAEAAGVSVTTVSVVLNGRQDGVRVPDATRERVRRVAGELDYRPNQTARNLRQRSSRAIGFVSDEVTTTPFATPMLSAAQEVAARNGHLLFVVNLGHVVATDLQRDAIDTLLEHQVTGLVFACMYHQEVAPPPSLPDGTVFVNCRAKRGPFRSIIPAEQSAAATAVRLLLDSGHRRIGYLDDTLTPVAPRLRLAGYQDALREYSVVPDPRLHLLSQATVAGGVAGGALLDLPLDVRPTAIFCFNDRMAMGLYRAARHRGLNVPGDLSIIGFDDQEYIASELDPPLTTMRLPHAEMGRLAIESVLDLDTEYADWQPGPAQGSSVAMLECPVVVRESVAPPAR